MSHSSFLDAHLYPSRQKKTPAKFGNKQHLKRTGGERKCKWTLSMHLFHQKKHFDQPKDWFLIALTVWCPERLEFPRRFLWLEKVLYLEPQVMPIQEKKLALVTLRQNWPQSWLAGQIPMKIPWNFEHFVSPLKLTASEFTPENRPWTYIPKRKRIFQRSIFRWHVNFWEGNDPEPFLLKTNSPFRIQKGLSQARYAEFSIPPLPAEINVLGVSVRKALEVCETDNNCFCRGYFKEFSIMTKSFYQAGITYMYTLCL